ncbi:MAG TPA: DUF3488 and transglutaminase-like domain-containing protein [Rhodanobacteraceae bacterium]|nr:DUF3488 and transglutaminase-like domain-containing protein [Rhodanobacteraceae bacterium]
MNARAATLTTASRKREMPALGQRAFDLLCLTMAAVLALHASHLPYWLTVVLALALGLRWWQRRRNGARIPWWVRLPLTLLLPIAVIATYGTIFGRLPGSALAVGLLVLKALESEQLRDARTGIAFACFALMCALLFGQSLPMTAAVILGMLPALACLRALEPGHRKPHWTREFTPVLKTLALATPLALAAFLFLPRLSSPLWGASLDADATRTGISGRMSPGDFTQLLIDDSPAFRVTFDGQVPPPAQRYFRGPVLWWFDGRSWTIAGKLTRIRHALPETMAYTDPVYHYSVSMEPSHQHWVFALDTPLSAPDGTRLTAEHTLVRRKPIDKLLHYQVRSTTRHILAPELSPQERNLGLELPAGFDPQARDLAQSWRKTYGDNDAAIAQAALQMFHDDGFRYTLTPPPLGHDSIDDFLFSTRAGFCEHYASAFTFLMRAAGIPARVVTGYQGGYWNASAHYLLVRQSDAHAWSEVWLKGRGWTRFDPTAAVRPDRVSLGAIAADGSSAHWYQHGWLKAFRNRWDIVNHWWDQAVVGFDALRQRGMLTSFGIRHGNTTMLMLALAASLIVLMALAAAFTLVPRRQGDRLEAAMALLRQRLARAGVARRPSEGPTHFFARAARTLPHERKRLKALGDAWVALRYAQTTPAPEAVRAFVRAVRDFRPRRVVK